MSEEIPPSRKPRRKFRTERGGNRSPGELRPGEEFCRRYTLERILGKGGMGIVWLAWDQQLERNVALKFLSAQIVHDVAVFADLKRETKRSLELTHPHIVRIHDFVQDGDLACISMEFVDGETLSALRIKKSNDVFDTPDLEPWLADWCQAMHYAHTRARVVHCDLKPANLMVNSKGALKITDFGIARSLSESMSTLTLVRGKSGTLVYMSPQQLNGEPPSAKDDIYAMGATLYELLTSKPPFYRGQIDRQIFDKVPPSVVERRAELGVKSPFVVPLTWEETIAACLAKEPSNRPEGAADIFKRLNLVSPLQVDRPSLQQPSTASNPVNLSPEVDAYERTPQEARPALGPDISRLLQFWTRRVRRWTVFAIAVIVVLVGLWRYFITLPHPTIQRTPLATPAATPEPKLNVANAPQSTPSPSIANTTPPPSPQEKTKSASYTKAQLEAFYDKAFRAFNAGDYPTALEELDALDARQSGLVASYNLRGVILMRQSNYDEAETALQKALAIDAKFWNARFNLAEIPFLKRNWAEARARFEGILQSKSPDLKGESVEFLQFKIFLTYIVEGKKTMVVDVFYAQFETSPRSPAAYYAKTVALLDEGNSKEANEWLEKAKRTFSPDVNRLYMESLYAIGWVERPPGDKRMALDLTSTAEQQAKANAVATEKFDQAERAFQQRDLTAAKRLADEADSVQPNQPRTINLRGEILLAQEKFEDAEAAFHRALEIEPKLREARYNLGQVRFKRKDYSRARDRFTDLLNSESNEGNKKSQIAQVSKFKIYLTFLLEGQDDHSLKVLEELQSENKLAFYYAQAAWEFKHNNTQKANDWIVSARKIYSPALNLVFADSFYDLGWLEQKNLPAAKPH